MSDDADFDIEEENSSDSSEMGEPFQKITRGSPPNVTHYVSSNVDDESGDSGDENDITTDWSDVIGSTQTLHEIYTRGIPANILPAFENASPTYSHTSLMKLYLR